MYKPILVCFSIITTGLIAGCSMYSKKVFSEPETGAVFFSDGKLRGLSNDRYQRFVQQPLPEVFKDSVSGTVLTVRIMNRYERFRIGPPLVPVIAGKEGYGTSKKHLNKLDPIALENVDVEIEIRPGINQVVTANPFSFYMLSRTRNMKSIPVSVNGILDSAGAIRCNSTTLFSIRFKPGMKVEDRPVLFLHSLIIDGKEYYKNGIPFKIGKRVFYSIIMPVNG